LTPSTQNDGPSKRIKARSPDGDAFASGQQDHESLKRALQETRRALTLTRAEAEKERELREALHAQLLDANAEIVASWDRRKEMARVIADQREKLTRAHELERAAANLKQVVANREQAIAKRDKMLADRQSVIANRDAKVAELKAQLHARYEELAVLERHIVQSTISGKAKRLARQMRNRTRKSFQGS
jgi:hypothetical protein